MPTIAELLERIKASGGTPSIDPGIDLRLSGTSVNTDPGIDWRPAGEYRNIDPGIDLRSSSGGMRWPFTQPRAETLPSLPFVQPRAETVPSLPFVETQQRGLSQFMDKRPATIRTEPRPKGWVPWDTQPYRITGKSTGDIRDVMNPMKGGSWWKTSNLRKWRQRNR